MTVARLSPWLLFPGRPALLIAFVVYHLVALLALVPYFFSWTGVCLAIFGYFLSLPGINIGYHRLLAHRGLSCSKRVEHVLVILGVLAAQYGPAYWVAIHRRHHQFADDVRRDPHSPRLGFFWSHLGWAFTASANTDQQPLLERYAKDLLKDPFYAWLDGAWAKICVVMAALYFAAGALLMVSTGGTVAEALQFGSSLVVWGVAVRTVWGWHVTMSVNSVTHSWGYRNHATPDDSRNNLIVGILTFGEGWHNNHHAFPRSARHGRQWWELDLTWLVIRSLAWAGLVKILDAGVPQRTLVR